MNPDQRRALALGALATLLYLVTAPAVVNPDGLGYLKLLPYNFAAGHLLYMPLLRTATRLFGDPLSAGRLLNALLGGTGVVLMYGVVRRALAALPLGRPFSAEDVRFSATLATGGLALSHGYWVQGADVEAYAAATVALLSTVRLALAYGVKPTALRAVAVGLLLGASVLCHLTHVLLAPFVAAYLYAHAPSRRVGSVHAALAAGLGGAVSIGAYAWAAFVVRQHDLGGAIAWIGTAAHGFYYGGGLYRLADAVYGLSRAVVWSPYLFEADAQRLLGQFLLGLTPLVALSALTISRRRVLPSLEWRLGVLWVAPYAVFGIFFFGSDSERWLFVLPPLWLLAAAQVAMLTRRARWAALILVYIGGLNFVTAVAPQHRDDHVRARATAAGKSLKDGDLLIFPGHSWDEYVSFYADVKVEPFPVSYYAARDGVDGMWSRLQRDVERIRAEGGRVMVARIFDEGEEEAGDPRGWDELLPLGLTRARLRADLRERHGAVINKLP
jgi:hypothetical protein